VAFVVVLDTCVLYPAHLRDCLLRLAELDLFVPRWSLAITDELSRNLIGIGIDAVAVGRLLGAMGGAFPEAEVAGYEQLIESMTCDAKDRHVAAAAVRAGASGIVTFNVRDFPSESLERYEIDTLHPDDFLLDLLDLAPRVVTESLARQAAANRREPQTVPALLEALERAGVPRFVSELRRRA
jgi:hypothetical protein